MYVIGYITLSFNKYYQSELIALREQGVEFSKRNPALAPLLSQQQTDPDVERLLEGFAFLTGRLRQKLDDELPELSHSLLQLLWPNYLRPVPSFSMIEFEPLSELMTRHTIAYNCEVMTKSVNGIQARFKTCYETDIYPLALDQVSFVSYGEGGELSLRFALTSQGMMHELDIKQLRLHLAGDKPVALSLYLMLLQNTSEIEVLQLDHDDQIVDSFMLDKTQIKAGGMEANQGLMTYPLNTFMGYRYLQEYFCFPEKFMFIDINGLAPINQPVLNHKKVTTLVFKFKITKTPFKPFRPSKEHFRLYCTPVVNLFECESIPLRVNNRNNEYKIIPSCSDPKYYTVYSVDKVSGWQPGGHGEQIYRPFESFDYSENQTNTPFYTVRQKPAVIENKIETCISFGNRQQALDNYNTETLSIELTCCNQGLASQLAVGDICLPASGTPDYARFKNIIPITPVCPPPVGTDILWKIVSNMSLNYLSMTDVKALRVVLQTYDFPSATDEIKLAQTQRMLDGLQKITHQRTDQLWQGLSVRGIQTELTIDPNYFLCEGDMYIFAQILNEFFALYTSLNSFHQLSVKSTEGVVYKWPARMGLQTVI